MKFKFKIQQYQTDAVEQTVNVFAGQPSKANTQYRRDLGKRKGQFTFEEEYVGWRNNDVELQGHQLLANIQQLSIDCNDELAVKSKSLEVLLIPYRAPGHTGAQKQKKQKSQENESDGPSHQHLSVRPCGCSASHRNHSQRHQGPH